MTCFERWNDKGGMSSEILTDALKEFDSRNFFPRTDGKSPFLILDCHYSRTELDFVKCTNDEEHESVVRTGLTCGTVL